MLSNSKNTLKLLVAAGSLVVLAGCASHQEEMKSDIAQAQADASEAKSMSQQAMNAAQQAQRDAQAALEAAQRNRAAMDRMFEKSMRK
ncbi:Lpp/OprI family alanine-zipper lipoprotein [Chromohalobacter sp. HP20-39]|uniref:Lpp/OprI family alanine-zipper lipoprotein n=1 Tax=Chromohalobacter sp. HP20-39 TaxID=3079306 RepID=UPI00294B4CB8|nr:Lpp/OprI family alanine-zipper lipoprotein [Chromohalobacter sp. HP20-39]MDV6319916.1 Lpp/OprI family alanine-zipper lipoprotein [Chromohalobacter sp. HP20-39]